MKKRQAMKILKKAQANIPEQDMDGSNFFWEPIPGRETVALEACERIYRRATRREYKVGL